MFDSASDRKGMAPWKLLMGKCLPAGSEDVEPGASLPCGWRRLVLPLIMAPASLLGVAQALVIADAFSEPADGVAPSRVEESWPDAEPDSVARVASPEVA